MPSQVSLIEQLQKLIDIANKNGLYDAADFLRNKVEAQQKRETYTDPLRNELYKLAGLANKNNIMLDNFESTKAYNLALLVLAKKHLLNHAMTYLTQLILKDDAPINNFLSHVEKQGSLYDRTHVSSEGDDSHYYELDAKIVDALVLFLKKT